MSESLNPAHNTPASLITLRLTSLRSVKVSYFCAISERFTARNRKYPVSGFFGFSAGKFPLVIASLYNFVYSILYLFFISSASFSYLLGSLVDSIFNLYILYCA